MTSRRWMLSSGSELPAPDVPIYLEKSLVEGGRAPRFEFRRGRLPREVAQKALDAYRWAGDNAISLLEEANLLSSKGRHARAFALASTALEETGKSQYAADVYTGFVSSEGFEKVIRRHEFKSAYASRFVSLGPLIQALLKDEQIAEELFKRRNDALYASPTNKVDDAAFEHDAVTMIDYCQTWIEGIQRQEELAERIGTKAFLK